MPWNNRPEHRCHVQDIKHQDLLQRQGIQPSLLASSDGSNNLTALKCGERGMYQITNIRNRPQVLCLVRAETRMIPGVGRPCRRIELLQIGFDEGQRRPWYPQARRRGDPRLTI